jgi:hypothetical protein
MSLYNLRKKGSLMRKAMWREGFTEPQEHKVVPKKGIFPGHF